ncbi:gamma-glutamylcyclotransferase family protein [Pantoea cypripedii]|uniref:Gamma-glutamylcyclotransferase AIG2-like domain-containing protein n=1 Tax=Pantoea cypripedii TaxID=55209 RepID=A0A1X1ENE4_PANCY|nr:gamma-glutamylcyclotransferase family protein [Pantoea cypripedii]ORM90342.1 hypothetical protein HA50_25850 [Pantoea cypripedii]
MESLFVYGTLGPGRPNAHILEEIGGHWLPGHVYGVLHKQGWGADMGFPGIRPDQAGEKIEGFLFLSEALAHHWDKLDTFEGAEYARTPIAVTTAEGEIINSYIYALR